MRDDLQTDRPFEADPYRDYRAAGHVVAERGDQRFALIVGYDEVKRVARAWQDFTSDTPFEVPIPHERGVRSVRQLPIEIDPPAHGELRALVEDRFSRRAADDHEHVVERVVTAALDGLIDGEELRVVEDLALPVVNYGLAATLGLPADDVPRWISWGTHAFRPTADGAKAGNRDLDDYLDERVAEALDGQGVGMLADLAVARIDGRPLERDELLGFANLMFAGGRDTVIAGIVNAFVVLAHLPAALGWLREDDHNVRRAVEEVLRIQAPLNYIGRHATRAARAGGCPVAGGELVALGFAAANRDPDIFEDADRCHLDRWPNRHVAFGHGPHTCLGAHLARMEMRVTLRCLARVAERIELSADPAVRHLDIAGHPVLVGFDAVRVRTTPLQITDHQRGIP